MFPTHIVAVIGMILNSEGHILMVKHPRKGWELPGGMVEEGETLIEALKREVLEETGISIIVKNLTSIYSNIRRDKHFNGVDSLPTKIIFSFIGERISGDLIKSNESVELGWFDRNLIIDMVSEPSIRERIKDMLNSKDVILYKAYSTNPYQVHFTQNL